MTILEIYYNHKHVSLQALYERAMRRTHRKPLAISSIQPSSMIKFKKKLKHNTRGNTKAFAEELRKMYIKNPTEVMTNFDIKHMSVDDLLDMHYFLTAEDEFDDEFDDEVREEDFSSSKSTLVHFARPCLGFLFGEFS